MTRLRLLKVLSILFVLFTAAAAIAQTSFVIERVDVSPGARIRPGVVRAEARLKAGRSYTAEQLDQALYRIRRLPFVADATYTLAPGSSDSSRVMIIKIVDQAFFNYNADVSGSAFKRTGGASSDGGFGLSFFPGSTGVLDLTAGGGGATGSGLKSTGNLGNVNLRYSAYGLFGTSAYASASLATRSTGGGRSVTPSFLIGLPAGRTQTLRARYTRTSGGDEKTTAIGADWLLDHTDDPFFARRGLMIVAGPERTTDHVVRDIVSGIGGHFVLHEDYSNKTNTLTALAEDFRPLGQHSAFWSRFSASRDNESNVSQGNKSSSRVTAAHVLFGLAHNFDSGRDGSEDMRRLRVEAGVGYLRSTRRFVPARTQRGNGLQGNAGFAYRSRWGVVHIDFTYTDADTLVTLLP